MKINSRSELGKLLEHFGLPKIIAEIGCAEGRYVSEILAWGIEKFYVVDLFNNTPSITGCASFEQSWHDENYGQVMQRIKGHEDKVIVLKGFSHEMAKQVPDESISLCYIDADHTKKGCLMDLGAWLPKVVIGGIVAGHDYLNPTYGVNEAVKEFCKDKFEVNIINENNSLPDAGYWFRKI